MRTVYKIGPLPLPHTCTFVAPSVLIFSEARTYKGMPAHQLSKASHVCFISSTRYNVTYKSMCSYNQVSGRGEPIKLHLEAF